MERVQIPLPRKGTETGTPLDKPCLPRVQIPLPRKGTETVNTPHRCDDHDRFKFHYPARGRKPRVLRGKPLSIGSNSITPQGDGNARAGARNPTSSGSFKIPLPRKGTETRMPQPGSNPLTESFKFHYPARGRKLCLLALLAGRFDRRSNSITPQGDGNLLLAPRSEFFFRLGSNSITPQGDGNSLGSRV